MRREKALEYERGVVPWWLKVFSEKKRPYLIFSAARFRPVSKQAPQKPQRSPCLPLVLFEGFLGSVQAQDAGHLQQESTTTLLELKGPNYPTTNKV